MNAEPEQPYINVKALGWTIGIHVLLFLLFLFAKYSSPVIETPLPELGMEVNLGTSDNGSGTDQPMNTEAPGASDAAAQNSAAASALVQQTQILQGNAPDAPAITPATNTNTTPGTATENNKKNTTAISSPNNAPSQQQRPKYVYSGGTGKGGNNATENREGTGEGNTIGDGDRGVPGGTPGVANYEGTPGNGTGGISHTLGRRTISPSRFEAEFNESGKVIIRVTVDKDGNIVDKRIKSSPSHRLSQLALQKLSQAKFSTSTDAAPQQFGEITIVFKTRS